MTGGFRAHLEQPLAFRIVDPVPIVSVVMPVRDTPIGLVRRALRSVVLQDFPGHVELVVWDDGSRPDLARRIATTARWAGRVLPNRSVQVHRTRQNRGISAARNDACAAANGRWFIWLDSDDELPITAVTALLRAVTRRSGAELAIGQCDIVQLDGTRIRHRNDLFLDVWRHRKGQWDDPAMSTVFPVHGALVRRELFEDVEGFDTTMSHGELTDWFLRTLGVTAPSGIEIVDTETYRYHKRADSHSADRDRLEEFREAALRRYADQVRAQQPHRIRFRRRCQDTGARRYDLFDTVGDRLMSASYDFGRLLPSAPGAAGHPLDRGVAEGDPGVRVVAQA